MKVSKKLKNKIIDFLKSQNYNSCEFDSFLSEHFNNGNPKEELIFLDFKDIPNIIEKFFIKFEISYNNMINLFKNPPKKNSREYQSLTTLQKSMLDEKEKFVKKMTKVYKDIRDNFGKILQEENQIFICPYCQRNYIGIFENEDANKGYTVPDLDHFYPKSKYPFLAATIFNLIPACCICNQRIKQDKDTYKRNIIPVLEENVFEKIEFNHYHTYPYINNYTKLDRKYKRYIEFFKIQEQYSLHSEIITEIQVKMNKYNRIKKKHLCECCPSLTEIKIEDLAFHEYKYVNKNKTPLWKLKQDIYKNMKNEIL